MLEDSDIDVAAITETWMTSERNNVTAAFKEAGYNVGHFYRNHCKGGGVALIFKDCLCLKKSKTFNFKSFECVLVALSGFNFNALNFIVIYRHGAMPNVTFLEEFLK